MIGGRLSSGIERAQARLPRGAADSLEKAGEAILEVFARGGATGLTPREPVGVLRVATQAMAGPQGLSGLLGGWVSETPSDRR